MVFNIFKKSDAPGEESKAESAPEGLVGLLHFIVAHLVDHRDDVEVKEVQGDDMIVLELKVNEEDMGKVIGKKGRIIKSLRIVMRAAGVHEDKRISIELKD